MVHTIFFTAIPFATPATGAAQLSTPSPVGLADGVTLVMVNRAGSVIVKLTPVTTVEVVLVAVKVCVVVVPLFICGFAELAVTGMTTVGPLPPCGGAPGVTVVNVTGRVPGAVTLLEAALVISAETI